MTNKTNDDLLKENQLLKRKIIELEKQLHEKNENEENKYIVNNSNYEIPNQIKKVKLSAEEIKRYSRQTLMPNFNKESQLKLSNSSVLIIGAGGLGSTAILYLGSAGF
eukprot:jgi/Orpsp1_1/1191975/evm.model.d7180000089762.1